MKYAALLLVSLASLNAHIYSADGSSHKKSYAQALITTTQGNRRSAISLIEPKDQLTREQQNLHAIQTALRKKQKAFRKIKDQIEELATKETESEAVIARLTHMLAQKQLLDLRQQKEQLQTKTREQLTQLEGAIAQLATVAFGETGATAQADKIEPVTQQAVLQLPTSTQGQQPKTDASTKPAPAAANSSWLSWPFGS